MSRGSLETPLEMSFVQYMIFIIGLGFTLITPLDIILRGLTFNFRILLEIIVGPFLLLWSIQKLKPHLNTSLATKLLTTAWSITFFAVGILGVISALLGGPILGINSNIITAFLLVYGSVFFVYVWRDELVKKLENYETIPKFNETELWKFLILSFPIFLFLFLFSFLLAQMHAGHTINGVEIILDTVRNSLFTGSIYLLLGVGLTLIFKILDFANFSHGELVVYGPYVVIFTLPSILASLEPMLKLLNPLSSLLSPILEPISSFLELILGINLDFLPLLMFHLILAFVSCGILALIVEFLVFRRLRARKADPLTMMIASIGVAFVLRFLIAETYTSLRQVLAIPEQPNLNNIKIIIIITGIILALSLDLLINRTKLGKAMRATADNPNLAQASGISSGFIIALVWFIGAGLAGVGGVFRFWANTPLTPSRGFLLLLPTFAVVILGGIGSYRGTILAAYILGFSENFGVFLLTQIRTGTFNQLVLDIPILLGNFTVETFMIEPSFAGEYQIAIGFLILVLVLLIKPTGLFGEDLAKDR